MNNLEEFWTVIEVIEKRIQKSVYEKYPNSLKDLKIKTFLKNVHAFSDSFSKSYIHMVKIMNERSKTMENCSDIQRTFIKKLNDIDRNNLVQLDDFKSFVKNQVERLNLNLIDVDEVFKDLSLSVPEL
ncbi:MAG: hypothetical protein WD607_01015 [Candidatus Paceibacterota bacterium]